MQKKSSRKSKSLPKAKAVSWSTDDVYNLLKAVNEITLKRMENKIDQVQTTLNSVQQTASYISNTLGGTVIPQINKTNQEIIPAMEQRMRTDIARINNWVNSILSSVNHMDGTVLPRVDTNVSAIKTRVGALTGRHSKRRAA